MSTEVLNQYIDHTLLRADATPSAVVRLCEEAVQYRFASVCVNGVYADLAYETLKGLQKGVSDSERVKVCCVVGFPLGAMSTDMKAAEAEDCLQRGAEEIDMVIAIGKLKAKELDYVLRDIAAVVTVCRRRKAICKVIIETSLLTNAEKEAVSSLAVQAGADFIKTSTGFAPGGGGATVDDVKLMATIARAVGKEVKASGGVRDRKTAIAMIKAGATRIGSSSGVAICTSEAATSNEPSAY